MTRSSPRQCQPCNGCCAGWVLMRVGEAEVFPGQPCPHCTETGCDDYANRPQEPCGQFNCAWIVPDSRLPDWMKPNQAKVIVMYNKLTWQGLTVDVAVPIGKRIPPRALNWLKAFSEQTLRPLIYSEQLQVNGKFIKDQQLFAHGPKAFQDFVQQQLASGQRLW